MPRGASKLCGAARRGPHEKKRTKERLGYKTAKEREVGHQMQGGRGMEGKRGKPEEKLKKCERSLTRGEGDRPSQRQALLN